MKKEASAKAHATVNLSIKLPSKWGPDCDLAQVFKQARDEAVNIISQRITADIGNRVRLIGEPEITAILVEEEH